MHARLIAALVLGGAVVAVDVPPAPRWSGDTALARVLLIGIDAPVH